MMLILTIWIALVLDFFIGDPRRLPHPVKLIGCLALKLETPMRRRFNSARTAGTVTALTVISATALIAGFCLWVAGLIAPWLGQVMTVAILYTCFAARDLDRHSRAVFSTIIQGDLPLARQLLARIVGRDTNLLDEAGVIRAAVESVAENTVDGVIAPMFFAFLGGPVAAIVYKAVSTLDSTFGYRNARYIRFGWASARMDDATNFLPARIGVGLMILAAWILGENHKEGLKTCLRDGNKHDSPNAGLAEAAMTGALGVQLGGPVNRWGNLEEMPRFGMPVESLSTNHIRQACRIMMGTTVAGAALFSLVRAVVCLV